MTLEIHDRKVFDKGTRLIRQGEKPWEAYLIHTGRVQIIRERYGQKHVIAELGPGDVCGEMALLNNRNHHSTAVALEQTVTYVIDKV